MRPDRRSPEALPAIAWPSSHFGAADTCGSQDHFGAADPSVAVVVVVTTSTLFTACAYAVM